MNLNTTAEEACSVAATTPLTFGPQATDNQKPSNVICIGRQGSSSLTSDAIAKLISPSHAPSLLLLPIIDALMKGIKDSGKATTFLPSSSTDSDGDEPIKLTVIILPSADKISRNNNAFSPHKLTEYLNDIGLHSTSCEQLVQINVIHDADVLQYRCCVAAAIARALPLYHSKSSSSKKKEDDSTTTTGVNVTFCMYNSTTMAQLTADSSVYQTSKAVSEGIRLSAKLGDMPPAELNPNSYSDICKSIANKLGKDVTFDEILGEELKEKGYGGIYGVGMAAQCPPRLVVMTYTPADGKYDEHVALCGKGVIYDTGGLALKSKVGMCGMKHDMGGSAGVLGGFMAAVQLKLPKKITLILAIVENAIGPNSVRNDDILTMKSGKTVEINNTDAEGRLILSDCVSHASNSLGKVDVILDMATLTGAQGIATGETHAGVLAKTQEMEERIVKAGLKTGDLVFPLLYAPELLKKEFNSKVADMKNSVKNRSNAQSSCAGHFIESHIDEAYEGDWVHVDMAYPWHKNERATGYGVALVLGLLKAPGFV